MHCPQGFCCSHCSLFHSCLLRRSIGPIPKPFIKNRAQELPFTLQFLVSRISGAFYWASLKSFIQRVRLAKGVFLLVTWILWKSAWEDKSRLNRSGPRWTAVSFHCLTVEQNCFLHPHGDTQTCETVSTSHIKRVAETKKARFLLWIYGTKWDKDELILTLYIL